MTNKQGFDKFAPLGPVLVSSEVKLMRKVCASRVLTVQLIPDPAKLQLTTSVNGELRQDTPVADLVFDVSLPPFLS